MQQQKKKEPRGHKHNFESIDYQIKIEKAEASASLYLEVRPHFALDTVSQL